MMQSNYFSLKFDVDKVVYLDQTVLPLEERIVETSDYEVISQSIERLELRGAPLIGIAAAYALAFGIKTNSTQSNFDLVFERIRRTRPTAVNLFFALNRLKAVYDALPSKQDAYSILLAEAIAIHTEDEAMCGSMGYNGASVFQNKSRNVLTHCNTGKFATGGIGTAFAVIKTAHDWGLVNYVYADETRPLLQGSRLTAYELDKNGIPFSIVPDSASAYLMQQGKVDLVITGADRICMNGDSANKVGTYSLAVNCKMHGIPFYIAAPESTIDRIMPDGKLIPIEERTHTEVSTIRGNEVTKSDYSVYNPSFDVTPAELITAIITDKKVYYPPYSF